jgi:hypothetical protein
MVTGTQPEPLSTLVRQASPHLGNHRACVGEMLLPTLGFRCTIRA